MAVLVKKVCQCPRLRLLLNSFIVVSANCALSCVLTGSGLKRFSLHNNIYAFNGDPVQMYVAGDSAEGHLVAMLMVTDWKLFDSGILASVLKGICLISGLF